MKQKPFVHIVSFETISDKDAEDYLNNIVDIIYEQKGELVDIKLSISSMPYQYFMQVYTIIYTSNSKIFL